MKKRFFFDTEFAEDGIVIDFISIGIVCDDGREFYEISNEFDENGANDWVKEHVIKILPDEEEKPRLSNDEIRDKLIEFVGKDTKKEDIEFWAYYSAYDWVVLAQLFGAMVNLPKNFPMFCYDIKQESMRLGDIKFPEPKNEHDALVDAKWNMAFWKKLEELDTLRDDNRSLFI